MALRERMKGVHVEHYWLEANDEEILLKIKLK